MAYYQLKDRVVDGTPCGPDTYDICVQGLCRVCKDDDDDDDVCTVYLIVCVCDVSKQVVITF